MKAVIQRVKSSSVVVDNKVIGEIQEGLLVLLGVTHDDTEENANYLAKKLVNLRIFTDENEKMNLSVKDIGGKVLIVSQFILYGDASHGNRPSFIEAAKPDEADKLYEYFCKKCEEKVDVQTGMFRQHMEVRLINDGPVTIVMEKVKYL